MQHSIVKVHIVHLSVLFISLLAAVPALGNTITVTNLNDSGAGSLRDAIANASPGDTINFNIAGVITLGSTITISKDLTVIGPGASNLAISGNNSVLVFAIDLYTRVTMSGLTITKGFTSASGGWGGGIVNKGVLTLTNCVITSNSAGPTTNGVGGGIFNYLGPLTLNNSTVSGNSAARGAGVWNNGNASLTVTNSTVSGNTATQDGGGIDNAGGVVTIVNTTVSGNSAPDGGGIRNDLSGTLNLSYSTVTGNSSSNGGGISILGNSTLTVKGTLLTNGPSANCINAGGAVVSDGFNLSDDNSCTSFLAQVGDKNGVPAGLDPAGLQNNGGPTQTVALLDNSPAVNAVPVSSCTDVNGKTVTVDQRGVIRPVGAGCDIGAFELVFDDDSGLAQLKGDNTFSGNQTINGTVTAASYSGDGSGLTNVAAATAATAAGLTCTGCVGNQQLGVNFAGSASQGGPAATALVANDSAALGGVAAPKYARLDIGNRFTGNLAITGDVAASGNLSTVGSLAIGSGTPIVQHLSTVVNPTIGLLGKNQCLSATVTLTGAIDGETIALGVPSTRMPPDANVILNYSAWVIAADTVALRVCNLGTSPQKIAASGPIRIDVWKH